MKINSRMIELGHFDSSHGAIVALGGGPKVVVVPEYCYRIKRARNC